MKHTISIIIPTFNEEETIVKMLTEIEKVSKQRKLKNSEIIQIIIADGGSTDLTLKKVKEINASNQKYVLLEPIKGKHLTKKQSIDMGVLNSIGEIVIFIDAD